MNLADLDFYNRTQNLAGAMITAARQRVTLPDPPLLIKFRRGYAEAPAWFMIQAAEFDPEPLTVEKLRVRDIYAAERYVQALMDIMASEKWFDRVDDEYHLTDEGREVMKILLKRPEEFFIPLADDLPADEVAQLADLMGQIIESSLKSEKAWCLRYSHRRANHKTPLLKIYSCIVDFNAFRDDSHMAAWQHHKLSGHTWEAFSFIHDGTAKSAAELFECLHYRGHTRQDYESALRELCERGWIENMDGTVTNLGKAVRAESENLTNANFYAAWAVLRDEDILARWIG